jgi:hypothetical protein
MKRVDILLIGSGSLARGIAYSLSQVSTPPLRVAILGRSTAKISQMVLIADARAASFGTPTNFWSESIRYWRAKGVPPP